MTQIAVTGPEYDKASEVFTSVSSSGLTCVRVPAGEEELARAVRENGVQHVVVGVERYVGPLYDALPRGGVIARFGVGHDGIDKERATGRGLWCTNTPGVLDDSVAELTVGLMLAVARHLPHQVAAVSRGEWSPVVGGELASKTLAVIGCGPIGCRVARMASRGLGMRVVGCDVAAVDAAHLRREFGFADVTADFAEAVSGADFVSLHVPGTAGNRRFIDGERLSRLSPVCWLINTARGLVVDEAALYDALAKGRLGGAALDVFEREPYVPASADRDLRTLPNVIMTPHVGSSTREACARMAARALENIRLAEAGRHGEMDLLNPAR